MVLVDSYSGWFEVDILCNVSSTAVISKRAIFQCMGHHTPLSIIICNVRYYTNQHFQVFAEQ